ncbi:hypothetical protein PCANB_002623 [Pneumocystis canis]|nr:hypothetical protein PCANB_002623 [Pneumocystis canis]
MNLSEDDVLYMLNNSLSTKTSFVTCKHTMLSYRSIQCSSIDYLDCESVLSSSNSFILSNKSYSSIRSHILSRKLSKRQEVALEILETERAYLNGLNVILNCFINPILNSLSTQTPILSRARISDIFSNFIDILNFNTELLRMLEERLDPLKTGTIHYWDPGKDSLGDIFLQMGPFMKMYSIYCRNFSSALGTIEHELKENSLFNAFMKKPELKKACNGLDLQSCLLSIVQRIPRYKLLIHELLRYTDKNHQDYEKLSKAFSIIEEVTLLMNETIRQHENWMIMLKIQRSFFNLDKSLLSIPSRHFIKEGFVYKLRHKVYQKKKLFLFSDCLIYATPVTFLNISEETFYYFNFRIPLDLLYIDNEFYKIKGINNAWRIISSNKSFSIYCDSQKEKEEWISVIENAKNEYLISKKTFQIISCKNPQNLVKLSQKSQVIKNYSTPTWIQDSSTQTCMICFEAFNWIKRKHHCRFCGKVVCHECSTNNFLISQDILSSKKKYISYFYSLFLRVFLIFLNKFKENTESSGYKFLRVCDLCYFSGISKMDDNQKLFNEPQLNFNISETIVSEKESLFDRNLPVLNKTSMPMIKSIRIKVHGEIIKFLDY